jgi:IS5 family transposase
VRCSSTSKVGQARELHHELRVSLLYRRFTRFYEDPIPDFSNLCRAFALFGKEATEQIHRRIVQQAQETAIIAGKKLRTDTTAVETNIHHPTDSSLLADSLRVMGRSLHRIVQGCQESEFRMVNHARAAKHRVLEIGRAARTFTQAGQEQLKQSYVPHHAEAQIRQGVEAWSQLQDCLRELAALNKERFIPTKAEK